MLHLMISFFTWRILARDCGLDESTAVALAVKAIVSVGQVRSSTQPRYEVIDHV